MKRINVRNLDEDIKRVDDECEDCEFQEYCVVYNEDPDFESLEDVEPIVINMPVPNGLYLTKEEVEWLRCELDCLNMVSEDRDIVQEALRLSGALDYILATQVMEDDEEQKTLARN